MYRPCTGSCTTHVPKPATRVQPCTKPKWPCTARVPKSATRVQARVPAMYRIKRPNTGHVPKPISRRPKPSLDRVARHRNYHSVIILPSSSPSYRFPPTSKTRNGGSKYQGNNEIFQNLKKIKIPLIFCIGDSDSLTWD